MIATKGAGPWCPSIAVLAAGFSLRLGRPKALVRLHGRSLLLRSLAAAVALRPPQLLAVVPARHAGYRRAARGIDVRFIANLRRAEGLASSVRQAVAQAGACRALFLLPVDLYELRPRDLALLVSRWRAQPRRAVARRIGARGGTPAIVPKHLFARCLQVRGETGLRELLNSLGDQLVLVDLPSAQRDLDTPADLAAARRRFRAI
jgi:CTP:molybdopterin cytidylyltransferase MocA